MRELAERYDLVGDARGLGMLVALELVKGRKTKEPAPVETKKLVEKSIRKGLLLQPPGGAYGNVIKMSPPLVMTDEQLDFGIRVLDDGLREVSREG